MGFSRANGVYGARVALWFYVIFYLGYTVPTRGNMTRGNMGSSQMLDAGLIAKGSYVILTTSAVAY